MAGGISSAAMGGSFLEGAAIGLAVTGFNHLMHPQEQPMETYNTPQKLYNELR
jgi:hypothetical protein